MNRVVLLGRLVRDPERNTVGDGLAVAKFTVAVNRNYKNDEGKQETDFFAVVAWHQLAENCAQYLKRGQQVGITGRIQTRSYDDKDGNKRYVTEIIADEAEFLTPKKDGEGKDAAKVGAKQTARQSSIADLTPVEDDDLPF